MRRAAAACERACDRAGNAMSLYDTACTALAEAVRVDEVKAVHDVTAAIAAYARRGKNHQLLADAVSLRDMPSASWAKS